MHIIPPPFPGQWPLPAKNTDHRCVFRRLHGPIHHWVVRVIDFVRGVEKHHAAPLPPTYRVYAQTYANIENEVNHTRVSNARMENVYQIASHHKHMQSIHSNMAMRRGSKQTIDDVFS